MTVRTAGHVPGRPAPRTHCPVYHGPNRRRGRPRSLGVASSGTRTSFAASVLPRLPVYPPLHALPNRRWREWRCCVLGGMRTASAAGWFLVAGSVGSLSGCFLWLRFVATTAEAKAFSRCRGFLVVGCFGLAGVGRGVQAIRRVRSTASDAKPLASRVDRFCLALLFLDGIRRRSPFFAGLTRSRLFWFDSGCGPLSPTPPPSLPFRLCRVLDHFLLGRGLLRFAAAAAGFRPRLLRYHFGFGTRTTRSAAPAGVRPAEISLDPRVAVLAPVYAAARRSPRSPQSCEPRGTAYRK